MGRDADKLDTYRRKRHFDTTGEPRGASTRPGSVGDESAPCFVVQLHDASTLHFDFRLEVDGVLKSWSVPKGPSADPGDKRLAIPTEDHPLEYRDFEGVIAQGEYGAGTVIVWDEGTYRPLTHDKTYATSHGTDHAKSHDKSDRDAHRPRREKDQPVPFAAALEDGHISFWLDGTKLHGGYALTRFRGGAGERESWLLVKQGDAGTARQRGRPVPSRARSARTGRTLGQVVAQERHAHGGEGT
ncbi:DNA polymerase ligase N-terminal domain-containing protein [Streptomyces zagrosensis]|uniref:DNA ligase D-like protein (Predicted 3'-phosphoesterase) n=1 Tax=Streptomyces zagrosensis TaxID=1042984 RepID=A0A7W9QD49_9ACTN|nr:DNA polymerase ligase N-terminal domain-containing protein [Streptomyces zagrosensis]MBB5937734.1 DNA ligase D-like protein (predicted 3'-phosphoesterase) [Streptomyces zagrosensis]